MFSDWQRGTVDNMVLTSERNVVKVGQRLDGLQFATDVEGLYASAQVCNGGVCRIVRTEDFDGLIHEIRLVHIIDWATVRLGESRTGVFAYR